MSEIKFCNLRLTGLTRECVNQAFDDKESFTQIVTVNAEFIVEAQKNNTLKNIINSSLSTIDGQVPFFFAKLLNKNINIEKISGSDYVFEVLNRASKDGLRVFFLGGTEESNLKCVNKVHSEYNIQVAGYSPVFEQYPFSEENDNSLRNKIQAFKPNVILVCFGAIKQEYWIFDNAKWLHDLGCNFAMGCGGTVDFISGKIKRAPIFIQRIGLEGVYRLIVEPKFFRLKRLIKSLCFFKYIW